MSMESDKVGVDLEGKVQNYAWGKLGSSSAIAQLVKDIDEDLPYAELWMGTHPNGPSVLKSSGVSLKDYIREGNPRETLGEECYKEFGGDSLPFLLKVLSVGKALSIQAHPDKSFAEVLHSKAPHIYKDPNHKPEMALALTDFEALCGFRPLKEIQTYLRDIPPFKAVIGPNIADDLIQDKPGSLKAAFGALMKCEKDLLKAQLGLMLGQDYDIPHLKDLFLTLHEQYPGDVGCFVIYFLNYVSLSPGEAIFLGPNLPHAYLKGDCVECMACSDNVVRAGLTPKLIDVPTLLEMLDYVSVEDVKFSPLKENEHSYLFNPPVKDFSLAKINIPSKKSYTTLPRISASILLFVSGESRKGMIKFLKAGETLEISACNEDILAFQAFCC